MMFMVQEVEKRKCPSCGSVLCHNYGKTGIGTQRVRCTDCGKIYTPNPKHRGYPEEVRQQAMKIHFAGASGRKVGQVMGFSKANVYNWCKQAKKNLGGVDK
jgi:transposase-like protein